jgi:hypothetical protein
MPSMGAKSPTEESAERFYRAGGPHMPPGLGGEIVQGHQPLAILGTTRRSCGRLSLVDGEEEVKRQRGTSAVRAGQGGHHS